MRPTFDQTVNVLVQAYLNDTLKHGDCTACAVGNIIAASIDCKMVAPRENVRCRFEWMKNGVYYEPIWSAVFASNRYGQQLRSPKKYRGMYKKQIDITGYDWKELARIEKAFESNRFFDNDESMFTGLMAVVDVLAEIHGIDLTVKDQAKLLFQKS